MKFDKLLYSKILPEELFHKTKEGYKFHDPYILIKVLREKTVFKYYKSFPKNDLSYLYNPSLGFYQELTHNELVVLVHRIFYECETEVPTLSMIENISKSIRYGPDANIGDPIYDTRHIAFTNGILNVKTGKFGPWSPEIFVTSRVSYNFNPEGKAPLFERFIYEFSSFHEDRVQFLRSWFWATLMSWLEGQVFLYIQGPGGTGKSQLALILTALIGRENVVTTTLKDLNNNTFECSNLRGKKLILISDTERYGGDISILNQIVGGDSVRGRVKFIQGAYEVQIQGVVMIVGNYPLEVRDSSNALSRRMRLFHAENISDKREDLISYSPGEEGWKGPLGNELEGIFQWIWNIDPSQAKYYLTSTETMVPSLQEYSQENKELLNPLITWAKEQLESGTGSFVGFKMRQDLKSQLEISRRKPLYPTYEVWAFKRGIQPLGHVQFVTQLREVLTREGFKVNKVRKKEGVYLSGIQVREEVYERDLIYGAPLIKSDITSGSDSANSDLSSSTSETSVPTSNYCPPGAKEQHLALVPYLYDQYISLLGKSPMKESLNKVSREYTFNVDSSLKTFLDEAKIPSEEYKEKVRGTMMRGITTINKFGAIPYSYKPMGTSPRILPVSYGDSLNNVKRFLREEMYLHLGNVCKEKFGMIILDLDLVSCYTSILLGLYPRELEALQHAIEGEGLWNHIYREFKKNGKEEVFNKPAVKICTYSSFFLGGSKAMIEGILESFRKDLGLTKREFRESSDYEVFHTIARNVTQEMQSSSIITDFRSISHTIRETYMDDFLVGPTGHSYKVTQANFPTAYANYLQSFEFALLASTTVKVCKNHPGVEIIGHYHDGNVLAVPMGESEDIVRYFSKELLKLGAELGLRYPQKIEIKRKYP